MSQVDDWADGYADSARDVNLYGPASANVPRSSVVSHQVRYRAPDTSDIPLAPGQNPGGSVYSNASGARMGQTKPASGYRAPAGGGWDVNSSDTNLRFPNESGGRRYASSKTKASAKPARKRTQKSAAPAKSSAPAKSAAADYGSYKDQSDPLSRSIIANGKTEPEKVEPEKVEPETQNLAVAAPGSAESDIDLSGLPQPHDNPMEALPNWIANDKAGAGINPFESAESLAAWKQAKLRAFPILPSEMSGGVPDRSVTRFRQVAGDPNSTVADVLSAENEAKKAAIDEGMTMDDIAAFETAALLSIIPGGSGKGLSGLRGLGGPFGPGGAGRAASTTGNAWAEGAAAAGDATQGARAFEEALGRMGTGSVRGAPTESVIGSAGRGTAGEAAAGSRSFRFDLSPEEVATARASHEAFISNLAKVRSSLIRSGMQMPDREVAAYMQRAGFYNNPEALQQAVFTIRKHGPSGLFERSADEAAAAGTYIPKYGKSPLETWQQERAATEAANAKFRDMFGFDLGQAAGREAAAGGRAAGREAAAGGQAASREAAADGGVSELANAGNAGRSSADEAVELAANIDGLIRRIESGTVDEMDKAWIEGLANQKAAGFENEFINNVLAAARAAGIIK